DRAARPQQRERLLADAEPPFGARRGGEPAGVDPFAELFAQLAPHAVDAHPDSSRRRASRSKARAVRPRGDTSRPWSCARATERSSDTTANGSEPNTLETSRGVISLRAARLTTNATRPSRPSGPKASTTRLAARNERTSSDSTSTSRSH